MASPRFAACVFLQRHAVVRLAFAFFMLLQLPAAGMAQQGTGASPAAAQAPSALVDLSPAEIAWLADHPVIRIAVDAGYAPYAFFDTDGQFSGLAADYAAEVSRLLGVRFEVVRGLTWPQILQGAKDRTVDLITTANKTPERASFLSFSRLYIATPLVVMTRADEVGVDTREDLAGRRVALVRGYGAAERALREVPGMQVLWVDNALGGLRALASGRADAYIGVLGVNVYLAQQNGLSNLKVAADFDVQTNGQHFAVRKDWAPLAAMLDKALDAIPDDQKKAMNARWVPVNAATPVDQIRLSMAEKNWLKAHPIIRVGIARNAAPFEFVDANGRVAGMVADYLDHVRRVTGLELNLLPYATRQELFAQAKSGEVDVIVGKSTTPERLSYLRFTQAFHASGLLIYVRAGTKNPPRALADLVGKRVAMRQGADAVEMIAQHYPGIQLLWVASAHDAVAAVHQGRAEAMIDEVATAAYALDRFNGSPMVVAAAIPGYPQSLHFAVRQDWPELTAVLDKVLASMSAQDQAAIRHAWLRPPEQVGLASATVITWALVALASALLIFAALTWRNRTLHQEMRRRAVLDAELRAAGRYKSDFLAKVSHEIRTPINIILGVTHLVNKTPLSPRQIDYVQKIQAAGRNLLDVINDILDLSKIESGNLTLETINFNLDALLHDLQVVMSSPAIEKGVKLFVVMDPSVPFMVIGDPTRLRQVLLNLLGNAIKFTERGRVVLQVRAQQQPSEFFSLTFEVTDTGMCIAPDKLSVIFEPFVQGTSTTTREHGGSGLGLSIARNLVERMGGQLEVSSELGRGSSFHFTLALPRGSDLARLAAADDWDENVRNLAGRRILVVEDNLVSGEMLTEVLKAEGMVAQWARSGSEAIEAIATDNFDVVLMDVQMPEMDGLDATRAIRGLPNGATVPVIAVTAAAQPQDRDNCMVAGMDDLISKPVDPARLLALLVRWTPQSPAVANAQLAKAAEPVLDVDRGKLRVRGNEQLYTRLLRNFLQDHELVAEEVEVLVRQRDRSGLVAVVHAVRGAAATIEARALDQACARILQALGDDSRWPTREDVAELKLQMSRALNAIEAHLPDSADSGPSRGAEVNPAMAGIAKQLSLLLVWVRAADARALDLGHALAPLLAGLGQGDLPEKLMDKLENFEFDQAVVLVVALQSAVAHRMRLSENP